MTPVSTSATLNNIGNWGFLAPCESCGPGLAWGVISQNEWHAEAQVMKRLLLLLVPMVLADLAFAFDGGGYGTEKN